MGTLRSLGQRQSVLSWSTREIRDEVYAPATFYMKNDYNAARDNQNKPDYADPLTFGGAAMVLNGLRMGKSYQDPPLRIEGPALHDSVLHEALLHEERLPHWRRWLHRHVRTERGAARTGELVPQGCH